MCVYAGVDATVEGRTAGIEMNVASVNPTHGLGRASDWSDRVVKS